MENQKNIIDSNENKNKIETSNKYSSNHNINEEEDSENYLFDFDGLIQKLQKQKNKGKNRKNEYLSNLLISCSPLSSPGKLELIKLLYSFNSNRKDKNYKYFLFQELSYILENLNQKEILEINVNQLIEILLEKGKFLREEGNIFYSYFHLYNSLYRDIPNIKNLRRNVKEEMIDLNNQNKQKFMKLKTKTYKEIKDLISKIAKTKIDQNSNEFLYVINVLWLQRAYYFINFILKSEENEREANINQCFSLMEVYNYYFNFEKDGNLYPYPGKIDNFCISDFKDIWYDPINDDENYLLKNGLKFGKHFVLSEKKDWDILKDIFGATNEIKRKINNLELIKIKVIILDKRFTKKKYLNLLKAKYIQTRENINIKDFKEKIGRCVDFTLEINEPEDEYEHNEDENFENIDEKNTCDEDIIMKDLVIDDNNIAHTHKDDELTNNLNIYENDNEKKNIFFYKLNQEDKELLMEIFTGFINDIPKYESTKINKMKAEDEEPLELLQKRYDESKEILIIEIVEKNSDSFLSEIEKNENGFQCSICKKVSTNGYNCPKCHMSFFCSKKCCEAQPNSNHEKFHEYIREYQTKNSNENLRYRNYNLVGLINLGNTCFINSTLQCLFYTNDLSLYFLNDIYKKEINTENKQGYKGQIADAFGDLLKKVITSNSSRVNPIDFLRTFFRNNKSLNLHNQQDAQEFLSILLDCLHEDLNRITNKPYILLEEQKDNESDSEASERFWTLHKKREDSIIVDLFHGQYQSKITCSTCGKSSITYEPFVFLGLPIPQQHNQEIIKIFFAEKWEYFGFELKYNSTVLDLKQKAINHMKNCGYAQNESNDALYDLIEFVQFDTNKIIKNIFDEHNKLSNNELLSKIITKGQYEIVLYEKKSDKDFYNLYAYPIKGDDYDSSSYPISISVNDEMNLDSIIKENKQKISKLYLNINDYDDLFIGLLHKKNSGWVYYFTNRFDSREFCPVCGNKEENYCLFNNKFKIGYILKKLKNYRPVLFVIGTTKKRILNKPLQIPNNLDKGLFFLSDCLKLFCEEEFLNNDNMWYCNKCKKHKTAKKQIRLFKLPLYLIIQIKKFKSNSGFFYSSNEKTDSFVKYPIKNLDLSYYAENNEENKQKYDLYAVIEHHGDISQGHYTAICKVNDIWILFNDSLLSKINNPVSDNAYLLFYRKNKQK